MTRTPDPLFPEPVDSRIGLLDFRAGYPSSETTTRLFDELDFQRAVQGYLWAIPLVSFAQWQHEHEEVFGASDGDLVRYESFADKLGLLTSNATTPYIIGFVNLGRTGPLVLEVPEGPTAGMVLDFWQRPVVDLGLTGPDTGHGGRYVLLGPGQEDPGITGARVERVPTMNLFHGIRLLTTDAEEAERTLAGYRAYPASQLDNPPPTRVMGPEGREWSGTQPRGIAFWETLARILEQEPVHERDRIPLATLDQLGIRKGTPFQPDERQTRLLTEATVLGEAMVRAIGYEPRFDGATVWEGTDWKQALFLDASQESEHTTQLDERTAWFYEAVTSSHGMSTLRAGEGQVYLHVGRDADGEWLIGDHQYELRVPADAPVEQFWSFTAYDADTRCFIDNPAQRADRSSRDDLEVEDDGSIILHLAPEAPPGRDSNWIPTIPGRGWFGYFRLYAPTQAYIDKTWRLPDLNRL